METLNLKRYWPAGLAAFASFVLGYLIWWILSMIWLSIDHLVFFLFLNLSLCIISIILEIRQYNKRKELINSSIIPPASPFAKFYVITIAMCFTIFLIPTALIVITPKTLVGSFNSIVFYNSMGLIILATLNIIISIIDFIQIKKFKRYSESLTVLSFIACSIFFFIGIIIVEAIPY